MVATSLLYLGSLFLVPDTLGTLLFAAKWAEAQPVLLPLSLAMVMSTAALGPSMVIYALGHARKTFRLMTIEAPLVFTLMITGTLVFGVRGLGLGPARGPVHRPAPLVQDTESSTPTPTASPRIPPPSDRRPISGSQTQLPVKPKAAPAPPMTRPRLDHQRRGRRPTMPPLTVGV